eukprot:640875-Rhodomonas_salina.1
MLVFEEDEAAGSGDGLGCSGRSDAAVQSDNCSVRQSVRGAEANRALMERFDQLKHYMQSLGLGQPRS